jgi:hypothetical protein
MFLTFLFYFQEELSPLFQGCGSVEDIFICTDHDRSHNYGYVTIYLCLALTLFIGVPVRKLSGHVLSRNDSFQLFY